MKPIRRGWIIGLLTSSLTGMGAAYASTTTPLINHDQFTVGQGDLEIQFALDPEVVRGDVDNETVLVQLGANYFLNDIFAPGLEFSLLHSNGDTAARFLPNLKAYWPTGRRFLPYFQIGVGYSHSPGVDQMDFAVGPGINCLLSNTAAFGIQFRYDLHTGDGTSHEIQFPIGFHLYFKI